jgi:hypothetical protein
MGGNKAYILDKKLFEGQLILALFQYDKDQFIIINGEDKYEEEVIRLQTNIKASQTLLYKMAIQN